MNNLTRILEQIDHSHPEATDELLTLLDSELRLRAARTFIDL